MLGLGARVKVRFRVRVRVRGRVRARVRVRVRVQGRQVPLVPEQRVAQRGEHGDLVSVMVRVRAGLA